MMTSMKALSLSTSSHHSHCSSHHDNDDEEEENALIMEYTDQSKSKELPPMRTLSGIRRTYSSDGLFPSSSSSQKPPLRRGSRPISSTDDVTGGSQQQDISTSSSHSQSKSSRYPPPTPVRRQRSHDLGEPSAPKHSLRRSKSNDMIDDPTHPPAVPLRRQRRSKSNDMIDDTIPKSSSNHEKTKPKSMMDQKNNDNNHSNHDMEESSTKGWISPTLKRKNAIKIPTSFGNDSVHSVSSTSTNSSIRDKQIMFREKSSFEKSMNHNRNHNDNDDDDDDDKEVEQHVVPRRMVRREDSLSVSYIEKRKKEMEQHRIVDSDGDNDQKHEPPPRRMIRREDSLSVGHIEKRKKEMEQHRSGTGTTTIHKDSKNYSLSDAMSLHDIISKQPPDQPIRRASNSRRNVIHHPPTYDIVELDSDLDDDEDGDGDNDDKGKDDDDNDDNDEYHQEDVSSISSYSDTISIHSSCSSVTSSCYKEKIELPTKIKKDKKIKGKKTKSSKTKQEDDSSINEVSCDDDNEPKGKVKKKKKASSTYDDTSSAIDPNEKTKIKKKKSKKNDTAVVVATTRNIDMAAIIAHREQALQKKKQLKKELGTLTLCIKEEYNQIHDIDCLQDYTSDDIMQIWWSKAEYTELKATYEGMIYMMEQNKDSYHDHDDNDHHDCWRGLEKRTEDGAWHLYQRHRDAKNIVLDIQEKQQRYKQHDPIAIATAYQEITQPAIEDAMKQGHIDAKEAKLCMRDLLDKVNNNKMKSSQKKSK